MSESDSFARGATLGFLTVAGLEEADGDVDVVAPFLTGCDAPLDRTAVWVRTKERFFVGGPTFNGAGRGEDEGDLVGGGDGVL